MEMKQFNAAEDDNDRRIDRVLRHLLPELPLSAVYSALRKKRILLNGAKVGPATRVRQGDTIEISSNLLDGLAEAPAKNGGGPSMPDILLETSAVLAVNKPAGVSVHGKNSLEKTVASYLRPRLKKSLSFTPGPLHRLDRNTTGLLFFGKSLEGARRFSDITGSRQSGKYYIALLDGILGDDMRVSDPVDGKRALSLFHPLVAGQGETLCLVRILTGRKHQIRIHAAEAGHPLSGDKTYGGSGHPRGYLLHAYVLALEKDDPLLGFRECRAPLAKAHKERLEGLFGSPIIAKAMSDIDRILDQGGLIR